MQNYALVSSSRHIYKYYKYTLLAIYIRPLDVVLRVYCIMVDKIHSNSLEQSENKQKQTKRVRAKGKQ